MTKPHIDKEYEAELNHIRDKVAQIGQITEEMIESSVKAFLCNDLNTAYQIIQKDDEVDMLEIYIDEFCLNVIAKRQPLGPDLRFIITAQKTVTDIERIADLCVNISEKTIELSQQKSIVPEIDLKPMTDTIKTMVRNVIDSFLSTDPQKAKDVELQDRTVDAYYAQVFRQLLELMRNNVEIISQATRIQAVINNLERIGDHAKNISEKVVYMATGKDVRHRTHRKQEKSQQPRGVLFLCVQNSARSQMAEGWAKKLLSSEIAIYSAGSSPANSVHPIAAEVMQEVGIDISGQQPKRITDVPLGKVDMVITLCSEEVCVNLPGSIQRKTWILPDPVAVTGEISQKESFRRIRDAIREDILKLKSEFAVIEYD